MYFFFLVGIVRGSPLDSGRHGTVGESPDPGLKHPGEEVRRCKIFGVEREETGRGPRHRRRMKASIIETM